LLALILTVAIWAALAAISTVAIVAVEPQLTWWWVAAVAGLVPAIVAVAVAVRLRARRWLSQVALVFLPLALHAALLGSLHAAAGLDFSRWAQRVDTLLADPGGEPTSELATRPASVPATATTGPDTQPPSSTGADAQPPSSTGADAQPPSSTGADVRYRAPTCELKYAYAVELRMKPIEPPATAFPGMSDGIEAWGELVVRPAGSDRMIIEQGPLWFGFLAKAQRPAPNEVKPRSFADVRLRTDGRRWFEEDGPTSLWLQSRDPNLELFWAPIPSAGGTVQWPITYADTNAVAEVETQRGALASASTERPQSPLGAPSAGASVVHTATVSILETSDGVVTLESRWRLDANVEGLGDMHVETRGQGRGEHRIVASSGRLLAADVTIDKTVVMAGGGMPSDQRIVQQHSSSAKLRLIEACDGPTTTLPPRRPPTDDERVLHAYAAIAVALIHEPPDLDGALERLAPELADSHTDSELRQHLSSLVATHGARTLSPPLLPGADIDGEGDGTRRFTLRGHTKDGAAVEVDVTGRVVDGRGVVSRIAVRSGDSVVWSLPGAAD